MLVVGLLVPLDTGGLRIPCLLHEFTGIPCPLCGMTRSVQATLHLHLGDALAVNPAGVAAVIVALGLLVSRARSIQVPRWLPAAGLTALWCCQLLRLPFS